MALPKFIKVGMTTLTFSRGCLYPYDAYDLHNQKKGESEGRVVRVVTLSGVQPFIQIHFERLSTTDFTTLRAWIMNPLIQGAGYPFTYRDHAETDHEVRWWEDDNIWRMPMTSFGRFSFAARLRVEGVTDYA